MHLRSKPRKVITNLIGQQSCLLSNWKKIVTKSISAQPTELQLFTIHDSDRKLADYLVLNYSKKRTRWVSQSFKEYKFYEKGDNQNAMKCQFKTNKILTALKELDHTVTTADGKKIHETKALLIL